MTESQRIAMQQALDALTNSQDYVEASSNGKVRHGWGNQLDDAEAAIAALRAALAGPVHPCKWPTCQTEKYQQDLADQIALELIGTHLLAEPVPEPSFWMNEHGQLCATKGFAERIWPGQKLTAIYTSPTPPTNAPLLTTDEYTTLAHRIASRYSHRSDPQYIAYTFLPNTLEQFVREIEQAVREKAGISGPKT